MTTNALRLVLFAGLNLLPAGALLGEPALFGDLGISFSEVLHTSACTIMAVRADATSLDVDFIGHWLGDESLKVEGNQFTVRRDSSVSRATWKFLAHRFSECVGQPITITVRGPNSYTIRGGVPLYIFDFPQNRFEITLKNDAR